jgi:DNA-directed RNA polymerase specialized sigma24 family protein
MQSLVPLNDLYADYAAGTLKKRKFEAAIFKRIQDYVINRGLPGWSREDLDDYASWFFLRISKAIDTYRETGSSFESYISTMIRMTTKEYHARQVRGYAKEAAAWVTQIPDMYACESTVEYEDHITVEAEEPVKVTNPRQMLILILKCSANLSADFVNKVSPSLGVEPKILGRMISHLKRQREKRETETMLLSQRAGRQLYRCILFEHNLRAMTDDGVAARRLRNRLEKGRSILTRMRKRLAKVRLDPSNAQIANLLGISKGTVDAVLHKLRAQEKNLNRQKAAE